MSSWNNSKILSRLVVVLVIVNILSLLSLWLIAFPIGSRTHNKSENILRSLQHQLQLSPLQVEKFRSIQMEFRDSMTILEVKMRRAKRAVNHKIFQEELDSAQVAAAAHRVADLEFRKEMMKLNKFRQVQLLLTAEQRPELEKLTHEILRYLNPKPTRPPKRK